MIALKYIVVYFDYLANQSGHKNLFQKLDNNGFTPFHIAVDSGCLEVTMYLFYMATFPLLYAMYILRLDYQNQNIYPTNFSMSFSFICNLSIDYRAISSI